MCPSYSVLICIYINYYIIFIYIKLHLGYIYCVSVLSSFNFWILYRPTIMQPSQLQDKSRSNLVNYHFCKSQWSIMGKFLCFNLLLTEHSLCARLKNRTLIYCFCQLIYYTVVSRLSKVTISHILTTHTNLEIWKT